MRKDNDLLRVAEEKETNAKRLAEWQEKRAIHDCTDPCEDYMFAEKWGKWYEQQDKDNEFIDGVKYE